MYSYDYPKSLKIGLNMTVLKKDPQSSINEIQLSYIISTWKFIISFEMFVLNFPKALLM